MLQLSAAEIERLLDFPSLIERLDSAFRDGATVPVRHHHPVAGMDAADPGGMLLLMPAWRSGHHIGIKIVTVFGANASRSLPSVIGSYLLLSAVTGQTRALMDGTALTVRRTAAASALAARHLARPHARRMVMVGAGALAPNLIRAHAAVRPIDHVSIWARDPAKAAELAAGIDLPGVTVVPAENLEEAVRSADLVSCATLSQAPLVRGAWLQPGTHLDLVGGFTPAMREADDDAIRRASVFVDTRGGACSEAGDITQPLASGALALGDIRAELAELCRGERPGRTAPDEMTLFKSVGTALEDLAAAELALERAGLERAGPAGL